MLTLLFGGGVLFYPGNLLIWRIAKRTRHWLINRELSMATREKRSSETRTYDFDFSQDLPPGVTLASVVSIAALPATSPPIAFGSGVINGAQIAYPEDGHIAPIGTVVQVPVSGGLIASGQSRQLYILRCVCNVSNNDVVEGAVRLLLNDTPP